MKMQSFSDRLAGLSKGGMQCALLGVSMLISAAPQPASASDDPVYFRLSGKHFNESVSSLEKAAGGRDQLVARLLELRRSEGLPYVSIRAEKLLLDIANEEGGSGPVSSALEADVTDPGYSGLARVVVTHIDSVESDSLRASLAAKAVSTHKSNSRMAPYLKSMEGSFDANVRSAARSVQ